MARTLQKDLNRIAETADTSSSEGLSYVLTGNVYYQVFLFLDFKLHFLLFHLLTLGHGICYACE